MIDCTMKYLSSFSIILCVCTVWFLCLVNGSRPPTASEWISEWKWTSLPPTGSWHTAKHTLTSRKWAASHTEPTANPVPDTRQFPLKQQLHPCLRLSLSHTLIPLPSSAAPLVTHRPPDASQMKWNQHDQKPTATRLWHTPVTDVCVHVRKTESILLTVRLVFKMLKRIKWLFWHSYCVPRDQIKDALTRSPKSILESAIALQWSTAFIISQSNWRASTSHDKRRS